MTKLFDAANSMLKPSTRSVSVDMTRDSLFGGKEMNRRAFVSGLGFVGAGLIASTLGGCEALLEQIENRPVRRRLRTGSSAVNAAITTYEEAVAEMKDLDDDDPRSWNAQAGLHGTVTPNVFNFCQHGTNHFFSWHRAYLYYFERICQELTGNSDFGLPYWNWNQNQQMHGAFTDPASTLSHERNSTSVAGNSAFSDSTMDTIFSDNNFFTFGSQLEGSPHNMAHVLIGEDMVTGGSPQDPIFWPHHCMVDYCWAKWNIELENDNTNNDAWHETSWNHFVNENGNAVEITAGSTVLMPLISYRYETSTVGSALGLAALNATELRLVEERIRAGADVRFDIRRRIPIVERTALSLARPFSAETTVSAGDFAALIESDRATERVFASINHARLPSKNDFFVRVFINLPSANTATPTDDPHFAGSFAFFGTHTGDHGKHRHKTDYLVNITDTLKRLRDRGMLADGSPISVQLVAVPIADAPMRPDAELVLDSIELLISPVMIRTR